MSAPFNTGLELIAKAVKPENLFRLIFLHYDHVGVLDHVHRYLSTKYPQRPWKTIHLTRQQADSELMQWLQDSDAGFVLIDNFHQIFESENLVIALNQRRDSLANKPIILMAAVLNDIAEPGKNLRLCMDRLRDFWSFRNLVQDLNLPEHERKEWELTQTNLSEFRFETHPLLIAENKPEKNAELQRLIKSIYTYTPNPTNLQIFESQIRQAIALCDALENYSEGRRLIDYVVDLNQENAHLNNSLRVELYIYSAIYWNGMHFPEKALPEIQNAFSLIEKNSIGLPFYIQSMLYSTKAMILFESNQFEKAQTAQSAAIAILESREIRESGSPELATLYNNLSLIHLRLSDSKSALSAQNKAIAMKKQIFGEQTNHPSIDLSNHNLACILKILGQTTQSNVARIDRQINQFGADAIYIENQSIS